MHIITKIFVVFAAILSVLLSALSVAYSTNAERITSALRAERAGVASAKAQVAEQAAKGAAERAMLNQRIDDLMRVVREREGDLTNFERDNQRLLADAKQAQTGQMSVLSKIDQLGATVSTQASLIQSYREEVQKLREEELRSTQREIELSDHISDLSGQLEVAIETSRALQEQLVELRDQAGSSGPAVASDPRAGQPVRARITEVRRDPASGNMLAAIDAGSNDRIREGMEMSIIRRGSFVAKLVVQSVTLNTAVGRVDTLHRAVEVQPGDLVTVVAR